MRRWVRPSGQPAGHSGRWPSAGRFAPPGTARSRFPGQVARRTPGAVRPRALPWPGAGSPSTGVPEPRDRSRGQAASGARPQGRRSRAAAPRRPRFRSSPCRDRTRRRDARAAAPPCDGRAGRWSRQDTAVAPCGPCRRPGSASGWGGPSDERSGSPGVRQSGSVGWRSAGQRSARASGSRRRQARRPVGGSTASSRLTARRTGWPPTVRARRCRPASRPESGPWPRARPRTSRARSWEQGSRGRSRRVDAAATRTRRSARRSRE